MGLSQTAPFTIVERRTAIKQSNALMAIVLSGTSAVAAAAAVLEEERDVN